MIHTCLVVHADSIGSLKEAEEKVGEGKEEEEEE